LNCSVYSAYEHSALHKAVALPLDITLETLFSIFAICIGVVLGSQPLKPIEWRVWANGVEQREGRRSKGTLQDQVEEAGVGVDPFRMLDDRLGFLDIRVSV
jgi:membrane magnesium transporter 1